MAYKTVTIFFHLSVQKHEMVVFEHFFLNKYLFLEEHKEFLQFKFVHLIVFKPLLFEVGPLLAVCSPAPN